MGLLYVVVRRQINPIEWVTAMTHSGNKYSSIWYLGRPTAATFDIFFINSKSISNSQNSPNNNRNNNNIVSNTVGIEDL